MKEIVSPGFITNKKVKNQRDQRKDQRFSLMVSFICFLELYSRYETSDLLPDDPNAYYKSISWES